MLTRLSLRHVVGVCLLAYAAAFNARPDIGSVRYVADSFHMDVGVITLMFVLFALVLITSPRPVPPPLIAFLSLPLLIFAVAGAIHAARDPATAWIACIGYAVPFVAFVYGAWEQAKRGGDGSH